MIETEVIEVTETTPEEGETDLGLETEEVPDTIKQGYSSAARLKINTMRSK